MRRGEKVEVVRKRSRLNKQRVILGREIKKKEKRKIWAETKMKKKKKKPVKWAKCEKWLPQ